MHAFDQLVLYKNSRVEAALNEAQGPLFSFRGPPPFNAKFGVHDGFIYYRYFLRFSGLAIIGPMYGHIILFEPSGIIEEPPRIFLEVLLAL